jgi:hypothetical protein
MWFGGNGSKRSDGTSTVFGNNATINLLLKKLSFAVQAVEYRFWFRCMLRDVGPSSVPSVASVSGRMFSTGEMSNGASSAHGKSSEGLENSDGGRFGASYNFRRATVGEKRTDGDPTFSTVIVLSHSILNGKFRMPGFGASPSERFSMVFALGWSSALYSKSWSIVSNSTGEFDRTKSELVEDVWLGVGRSVSSFCNEFAIESCVLSTANRLPPRQA